LQTDEAILQPYTLVEDNMKTENGLKKWLDVIKIMRERLAGTFKGGKNPYESIIEKNKVNPKPSKVLDAISIRLPGSTKLIKVKAKSFFDKLDKSQLDILLSTKTLDLSNYSVETENQHLVLKNSEFQKSFLKKYKKDIKNDIEKAQAD